MHVNVCERVLGSVRERIQSRALTHSQKKHNCRSSQTLRVHPQQNISHERWRTENKIVADARKNNDARTIKI